MQKRFLSLTACVTLTGCIAFQNLTTEDILRPEYLRRTATIEKTIPQIQQALYDYSAKCSLMPALRINPSDPNSAILQTTTIGWTKQNPAIVIQLTQNGKQTKAEGYSYSYEFAWPTRMDELFQPLVDPTICK